MSKATKDVGGDYTSPWGPRTTQVLLCTNVKRGKYDKSVERLPLKEEHLHEARDLVLNFMREHYDSSCYSWDYEEIQSCENVDVWFANPRVILEFDKCDFERIERQRKLMLGAGLEPENGYHLRRYWDLPNDWYMNKIKYWEDLDKDESSDDLDEEANEKVLTEEEKMKWIKEKIELAKKKRDPRTRKSNATINPPRERFPQCLGWPDLQFGPKSVFITSGKIHIPKKLRYGILENRKEHLW